MHKFLLLGLIAVLLSACSTLDSEIDKAIDADISWDSDPELVTVKVIAKAQAMQISCDGLTPENQDTLSKLIASLRGALSEHYTELAHQERVALHKKFIKKATIKYADNMQDKDCLEAVALTEAGIF